MPSELLQSSRTAFGQPLTTKFEIAARMWHGKITTLSGAHQCWCGPVCTTDTVCSTASRRLLSWPAQQPMGRAESALLGPALRCSIRVWCVQFCCLHNSAQAHCASAKAVHGCTNGLARQMHLMCCHRAHPLSHSVRVATPIGDCASRKLRGRGAPKRGAGVPLTSRWVFTSQSHAWC